MTDVEKIKQELQTLVKAQVLDKQIYDMEQELISMPEQEKVLQQDCDAAKAAAQALEEKVKTAKLAQKEKEGELSQKEEGILKLEVQLSQVKTNKEYSAIQNEIKSAQADNSVLEEGIILLMDEVEAANKDLAAQQAIVKKEEQVLSERKAEFQQRQKEHAAKIEILKGERIGLMEAVSSQTRELYERILSKKSGMALVPMNGENCSACQILLRPQIQNEVKMCAELVACEKCSRILYDPETLQLEAPAESTPEA